MKSPVNFGFNKTITNFEVHIFYLNMKKLSIFLFSFTTLILVAQQNTEQLSHCSGAFTGSDITESVVSTCDGSLNLISGSCTGECYDYFDLFLEAGESIVLSACSANGAIIPDADFDIYFSIWTNSPDFDVQLACSDSFGYFPDVIFQTTCTGDYDGESSEGTEIVFVAPADGIYRIEISDWLGSFADGSYTIAISCPGEGIEGEMIPTLSQWGLILLCLVLMSFGAIQIAFRNASSIKLAS